VTTQYNDNTHTHMRLQNIKTNWKKCKKIRYKINKIDLKGIK